MPQEQPGLAGPLRPFDLVKHLPEETFAVSAGRRWAGLDAVRYRNQPPNEVFTPPSTHHLLVVLLHAPKEFEARFDEIKRAVPPPPGSILFVPAGNPAQFRWSNYSDSLHVFLEPGLVARVAAEEFDLDPAHVSLPPLDGSIVPPLRAAMLAVNDELTAETLGGRLAAESLANIMAVHLIRNAAAPRRTTRGTDGALPRQKLRAVVEYVEEHLHSGLTLERMATVAHLSPYHFARQFKVATGLPPHQYVIVRRVELAQQLLREGHVSLAEVAVGAGFSDQSHFSQSFKRIVGVTPGQFRKGATIADHASKGG